jgi:hypothetical protein
VNGGTSRTVFGHRRDDIVNKVRMLMQSVMMVTALGAGAGCAAMAAHASAVDEARNACYQLHPGELYQETFALLSASYPIARESESRGYLETGWGQYQGAIDQSRVTANVTYTGQCSRVSLQADAMDAQTQAVSRDEMTENNLYLELHRRVQQRATAGAPPAPGEPPR